MARVRFQVAADKPENFDRGGSVEPLFVAGFFKLGEPYVLPFGGTFPCYERHRILSIGLRMKPKYNSNHARVLPRPFHPVISPESFAA
jgi:hypothetical protein